MTSENIYIEHTRRLYLAELRNRITKACQHGLLGKVNFTPGVSTISGPRAAVAMISAGQYTGDVLRSLIKSDNALARQLVPFPYDDHTISVFLHRWYVRLEAGWPRDLQQSVIPLDVINKHPLGDGRWVVGVNETGTTVIASLDDSTPHWLIAGQTGSGKTVAIHNMLYQFAKAGDCLLVLIDGKRGESLKVVEHLPNVLGTCATDVESARGALTYAVDAMHEVYEKHQGISAGLTQRLVIVFDEFQEFATDKIVAVLMRQLVSLGRAAKVHCVFATQHPLNAVMGDSQTKRNMTGRLVFRVTDFTASQVAVGHEMPRADRLTGQGDCYCQRERVQGSLVTLDDLVSLTDPSHAGGNLDWHDLDPGEAANTLSREPQYTTREIAFAILSAVASEGRELYRQRFDKPPGGSRGARLVKVGREVLEVMRDSGEVML